MQYQREGLLPHAEALTALAGRWLRAGLAEALLDKE